MGEGEGRGPGELSVLHSYSEYVGEKYSGIMRYVSSVSMAITSKGYSSFNYLHVFDYRKTSEQRTHCWGYFIMSFVERLSQLHVHINRL